MMSVNYNLIDLAVSHLEWKTTSFYKKYTGI